MIHSVSFFSCSRLMWFSGFVRHFPTWFVSVCTEIYLHSLFIRFVRTCTHVFVSDLICFAQPHPLLFVCVCILCWNIPFHSFLAGFLLTLSLFILLCGLHITSARLSTFSLFLSFKFNLNSAWSCKRSSFAVTLSSAVWFHAHFNQRDICTRHTFQTLLTFCSVQCQTTHCVHIHHEYE